MTFFRRRGRGLENFTCFMTGICVPYDRWNKGSSKVEMSACLTLIFISSNTLTIKPLDVKLVVGPLSKVIHMNICRLKR